MFLSHVKYLVKMSQSAEIKKCWWPWVCKKQSWVKKGHRNDDEKRKRKLFLRPSFEDNMPFANTNFALKWLSFFCFTYTIDMKMMYPLTLLQQNWKSVVLSIHKWHLPVTPFPRWVNLSHCRCFWYRVYRIFIEFWKNIFINLLHNHSCKDLQECYR